MKSRFERAVKTADPKIDALVYELYGLTDEEIKVVEGGRSLIPPDSSGGA